MADSNYERVTKAVNAVANGLELGIERERAELALLATIAQVLAAIVDELHELNERSKQDG